MSSKCYICDKPASAIGSFESWPELTELVRTFRPADSGPFIMYYSLCKCCFRRGGKHGNGIPDEVEAKCLQAWKDAVAQLAERN